MKYKPASIEFETLDGGDFSISLDVYEIGGEFRTTQVTARASELVGMDFLTVVSLFRTRINQKFGV